MNMALSPDQIRQEAFRKCESPIEDQMLTALIGADWEPFIDCVHVFGQPWPAGDLVIMPQFPFGPYRLDFLIMSEVEGRKRWLCVECDGKEFHDSTAEQHERDRVRDDWLRNFGIHTQRYSGAQIHVDPRGCAEECVALMKDWL